MMQSSNEVGLGMKREAVRLANKLQAQLTGDFQQIREILEQNDMVVAIWQDRSEQDGVGLMLIKGDHLLARIAQNGRTEEIRWNAIPCVSVEQATVLRNVAGEQLN